MAVYDLIKTSSKEEFIKAIRYFEFIGARNEQDLEEDDFHTFPIVVVESTGKINAWAVDTCPYERYNEISIPAEFLNRKVYTREDVMEKFNCIII